MPYLIGPISFIFLYSSIRGYKCTELVTILLIEPFNLDNFFIGLFYQIFVIIVLIRMLIPEIQVKTLAFQQAIDSEMNAVTFGAVLYLIFNQFLYKIKVRIFTIVSIFYLTSRLTKGQRKPPIEVSISGKSMVGFEGLLVHNNF